MNTPVDFPVRNGHEVVLIAAAPPARLAFRMTPRTIRTLIPAATAGTYLLLRGRVPVYVGRSDRCLQTRLATHNHLDTVTHVVWEPARDPWAAFCLEAWWWHQHKDILINKIHPAVPTGNGPCPFCDPQTVAGLTHTIYKPINY